MPKLLFARPPHDKQEERQIRKLAGSRHAPGDWILRARMIVGSWEHKRSTAIARDLGCHPQTIRERILRFNAEGLDGLGDLTGKLGWNEADADYGPQRVSGHPMSVDFGVAAKEIHFMFRPTKTGHHSATLRAYIGTWRNGHPWIVSRLRGAQLTWHLIIH